MCVHFLNFDHLRITLQSSDLFWGTKFRAPSLPLPSLIFSFFQAPWLPMMVSFFLTHLLLEVASPIIFIPSPFCYHCYSRSKGLHWWRRSKAYKLHMKLHHVKLSLSAQRSHSAGLPSFPPVVLAMSGWGTMFWNIDTPLLLWWVSPLCNVK